MKIIIYATHSFGTFDTLKQHPDIVILGWGEKWKGFIQKAKTIEQYLHTLPEDEIVVIIDGFDSYIKKTEGVYQEFENMNCKVLLSLNKTTLPAILDKYAEKKVFTVCKDNLVANAGLMMGYVKYLKIVWDKMIHGESNDDQRNLNIACKELPFVKIDKHNKILQNCASIKEVNESRAYFCQTPGNISFTRVIRAIQEYYKYFIPEIIFILSIVLMVLYFKKIKLPSKKYLLY